MGKKLDNARHTTCYIGRYAKRPAMAQSRIKEYDGEYVTFEYEDKRTGEHRLTRMPAQEFLGLLVRHIPDKGFRMIRYSGIYAARTRKRDVSTARVILKQEQGIQVDAPDWRQRRTFQNGLDPLVCPRCGKELVLVKVVYRSRDGPLVERTFDN